MIRKNRLFILAIFAIGIFTYGCEELLDLISFDTDYQTINFTINPEDEPGEKVFDTVIVKSELNKWLEDEGFSVDDVESVVLKEATFNIKNVDPSVNFDPISSVSAKISTDNDPEITIASKSTIPSGSHSVSLDVNDSELKGYLTQDEFVFTAMGVLKDPITETINVQAKIKFTVD